MTSAALTDHTSHRMPPEMDPAARAKRTRQGRRTLLLLAFVCILPVAASYFAFYVWQPQSRMNYGELIGPAPVPDRALLGAAGQGPFSRDEFAGRWTLVYAGAADCGPACVDALYTMRQSRLAQAKEMERVGRLWLVTGSSDVDSAMLGSHDGLRIARADAQWLAALPGAAAQQHIYLVDPLGNVMMRFPEQADPRRVIKDLQRLLKYSALGRG